MSRALIAERRQISSGDIIMKDMLKAPFLTEMIRTQTNMYEHGWDERNGA